MAVRINDVGPGNVFSVFVYQRGRSTRESQLVGRKTFWCVDFLVYGDDAGEGESSGAPVKEKEKESYLSDSESTIHQGCRSTILPVFCCFVYNYETHFETIYSYLLQCAERRRRGLKNWNSDQGVDFSYDTCSKIFGSRSLGVLE